MMRCVKNNKKKEDQEEISNSSCPNWLTFVCSLVAGLLTCCLVSMSSTPLDTPPEKIPELSMNNSKPYIGFG